MIDRSEIKRRAEEASGKKVSYSFITNVANELNFHSPYSEPDAARLVEEISMRKRPKSQQSNLPQKRSADESEQEFSHALKGTLVPAMGRIKDAIQGISDLEERTAEAFVDRLDRFDVNVLEIATAKLQERSERGERADVPAVIDDIGSELMGVIFVAEAYALPGM